MRVFLIGRNYQPTGIDAVDAAWRYNARLVADANPVLMRLRQCCLPDPSDWRAAVASAAGLARLGAEGSAVWWQARAQGGRDRQVQP